MLTPRQSTMILVGTAFVGLSVVSLMGRGVDRSTWSDLPCIEARTETYRYMDDRPHKQGGRGGVLTGHRSVCVERATVGPVLPHA